jgi:hypothetical protein
MKHYNFEKDSDSRWYIILPEWEGSRDDLEMVDGADLMLDILSQGERFITVGISTDPINNPDFILTLTGEAYEGAYYDLIGEHHQFDVWLCFVTKFVFGEFPKKLYIKK